MKKLLLALVLSLFCGVALAGDSGVYSNPDRDGEGLSLHVSGTTVVGFLFTYGQLEEELALSLPPIVSPQLQLILDPPLNGQRWFLISGDELIDNQYVTGKLYQGGGLNYPVKLHPHGVGAVVPVGNYLLERSGDGWSLTVENIKGGPLGDMDPLFMVIFDFDLKILDASD